MESGREFQGDPGLPLEGRRPAHDGPRHRSEDPAEAPQSVLDRMPAEGAPAPAPGLGGDEVPGIGTEPAPAPAPAAPAN